jgi:hypothetical protein
VAVFIDEKNGDGMRAFLLLAKDETQGDGALRVNRRQRGSDDGIENAEEAEFPLVIDRRIAEGGDLNIHAREVE